MGQKDLTEKSLEFYPDVFADIVNALLYQGEQVILVENLQAAPTETLYRGKQDKLRNQFHDVSKYVMHQGEIKVQYTLENETVVKRKTVLRKAGYAGAVYREQYDRKGFFPFVSILLFWGRKRWKAPRNLKQLLDREDIQGKCWKYVDNISLHVYEMAHLSKKVRERFHSDMRIVVDYLAEGKNYVPSKQKIVHLEALLLLLRELTGDVGYEEIIPDMLEEQKRLGGINMCELLDKYERRGREAGRTEGITVGMERVNSLIRRLIGDGRSEEVAHAVSDNEFQKQLFMEYGL